MPPSVTALVESAFQLATTKYPGEHGAWIDLAYRLAGRVGLAPMVMSVQRLGKPVEFSVRLGESQDAGSVSMHFEGSTWRLSAIGLPRKVLSSIVDRLPSR